MSTRRWLENWKANWKKIIVDTFSAMGFLWLLIGITDYFFSNVEQIKSYFLIFIVLSIPYGLGRNYPKQTFQQQIRGKDSFIELKIGDAFSNKGALIVPMNNEFDLSLGGNVKKVRSIQNQLITDFYDSKVDHLESDIQNKINLTQKPFPIGTTIEVEQKRKRFYLLVNSIKNQNNRVGSSLDDFFIAINGIWDYLAEDASKGESVTIPLINTQHSRNPDLTREFVIKQLIDTFIDNTKRKSVCDKLIISIHPSDIEKGNLDFDELCNYLKFQTENYKDIKYDIKPVGKESEPSVVSSIDT